MAFEVSKGLDEAEDISEGRSSRGYVKGHGKFGRVWTLTSSQGCLGGRALFNQQRKTDCRAGVRAS